MIMTVGLQKALAGAREVVFKPVQGQEREPMHPCAIPNPKPSVRTYYVGISIHDGRRLLTVNQRKGALVEWWATVRASSKKEALNKARSEDLI